MGSQARNPNDLRILVRLPEDNDVGLFGALGQNTVPNGGEGELDEVDGPQMYPVLARVIVKGQQLVPDPPRPWPPAAGWASRR